MGFGDLLFGDGLSITAPDDRLPGPMSLGLTGFHCPLPSRTSKYFRTGAGGYDASLRVAKNGPELAYVLGGRVVPVVLQRPRIAADPDFGQGMTLVVADQPVDGLIGPNTRGGGLLAGAGSDLGRGRSRFCAGESFALGLERPAALVTARR